MVLMMMAKENRLLLLNSSKKISRKRLMLFLIRMITRLGQTMPTNKMIHTKVLMRV